MHRKIPSFLDNILLNMNKKGVITGFLVVFFANVCIVAQEKPQILINLARNDRQSGIIELSQPERLESMLMMQISNNRQQKGIPGYRVRIFSQSGQNALPRANEIRMGFINNFPEMEAYQEYNNPNFQIFVGDFRTKSEALREMKRLERRYSGAFIVPAVIDISK